MHAFILEHLCVECLWMCILMFSVRNQPKEKPSNQPSITWITLGCFAGWICRHMIEVQWYKPFRFSLKWNIYMLSCPVKIWAACRFRRSFSLNFPVYIVFLLLKLELKELQKVQILTFGVSKYFKVKRCNYRVCIKYRNTYMHMNERIKLLSSPGLLLAIYLNSSECRVQKRVGIYNRKWVYFRKIFNYLQFHIEGKSNLRTWNFTCEITVLLLKALSRPHVVCAAQTIANISTENWKDSFQFGLK